MSTIADTLYLCATGRLARRLRTMCTPGARMWRPLQANTLSQWFADLAEEAMLTGYMPPRRVLSGLAERLVWEQVIGESINDSVLFDIAGLANRAAEAESLRQTWNLAVSASGASEETRAFLRWQHAFRQQLSAHDWLTVSDAQIAVIDAIEAGQFELPAGMVWLGFDGLTPLQQRLLRALAARGVEVETRAYRDACAAVDLSQTEYADPAAESEAIARWVIRQRAVNPQARLGIVVTDLANERDRLAASLDAVLHPQWLTPEHAETPRVYNISLGRALSDVPLVHTALVWLSVASAPESVEQAAFSYLVRSPYSSDTVREADARARLEVRMRRKLAPRTGLTALRRVSMPLGDDLQVWMRNLDRLQAVLAGPLFPRRQLPSQWRSAFMAVLEAVSWPGTRVLSSGEFQAHAAFLEVLSGLGGLDAVSGRISVNEAVNFVMRLTREQLFQPQTHEDLPIQVLGRLESAGLRFDALWVSGVDALHWPGDPRPNPLLPAAVQKRAGVMHASAEVELIFARRVIERLSAGAPVVRFSYALHDVDGRERGPSPLLAGLRSVPAEAPQLFSEPAPQMEQMKDTYGPAIPVGETVSGGVSLLAAQAICPAWAFYQYRLGARALETPVEGLDDAARGAVLHAVLEAFWRKITSSTALAALSPEAEVQAIRLAVETGLAAFEAETTPLPRRFRQLEATRLAGQLGHWLSVERSRERGFTVVACEAPVELSVEGLVVRVRIDRIDALDGGGLAVLDYKTGRVDMRDWWGARLRAPQLPLYATLAQLDGSKPLVALAFAQIKREASRFMGVALAADLLPGVHVPDAAGGRDVLPFESWNSVLDHWRQSLIHIAREFRDGVAGVVFEDVTALRYCEVKPILRLAERQGLDVEDV